jgi:hypothetical protein
LLREQRGREKEIRKVGTLKLIKAHTINTSNSSNALNGTPMLSHSERRRQIVEKLFSPPDRDFISPPSFFFLLSPRVGVTYKKGC